MILNIFRDDDRDKAGLKSSSSEESVQRRTQSSTDSMLSDNYTSVSSSTNSPSLQYAPITWTKVSDLAETNENATVLLNQAREVLETTV